MSSVKQLGMSGAPRVPVVLKVIARSIPGGYARLLFWLQAGAAIAVFMLMLLVGADVVGRYIFGRPVYGAFEVSEAFLSFVVFLGLAYTQHMKGHIKIEMVVQRLPARARAMADFLSHVIGLALFLIIFSETLRFAVHSFRIGEQSTGMATVPIWPARFTVPVGSFLLALQFAIDAIHDMRRFLAR